MNHGDDLKEKGIEKRSAVMVNWEDVGLNMAGREVVELIFSG